jgi:hypothetical protein
VTTYDNVPNAFSFPTLVTSQIGVPPCFSVIAVSQSLFTTGPVVITGLTTNAAISVTALGSNPGAAMSINGGPFITGSSSIANGQTVVVQIKTVGTITGPTQVNRATLNIGGVTANVAQTCN